MNSQPQTQQALAGGLFQKVDYPPIDFDHYHQTELPKRLGDGAKENVLWSIENQPALAIQLEDGRAYSYCVAGNSLTILPGIANGVETVVLMSEQHWIDYAYEMLTMTGLLYANAVSFARGSAGGWGAWDPALRNLYSNKPIFNPELIEFRDRRGAALDLQASFAFDDDADEMSHFLRETGYLVVRNVFSDNEITAWSKELQRIESEAVEGELRSWWADDGQGGRIPYRLTYLNDQSDAIKALYENKKVVQLRELAKENVVPIPDRIEGILAVIKNFATNAEVSGYANLPFHNDCGLGGCHVTCPCVLVGIQLDDANESSSQLHMMPGTWGKAFHGTASKQAAEHATVVPLRTQRGDATVHIGCGLHAGPAPTGPQSRRTIYVQHYSPRVFDLIEPYSGYNELIPGYGRGQVVSVEEHLSTEDH